ncbi:MAG: redoxin domain-containing protein [Methanomassiliicoccus sp.]|nr:redoxin domain-containing protein [Methanomassiliicoccus sp.]
MTDDGPKEGEKAPDFCLPEASETIVCLYEELKRSPMMLIFYPTDFGITCTLEFKRFKEMLPEFTAAGVRLLGISVNSTRSHRSWKEKMDMDIPLLCDTDAAVSKLYDVMSPEKSLLKGYSGRAIFIVDAEGIVTYKWVAADTHFQPDYDIILNKVRELQAPSL